MLKYIQFKIEYLFNLILIISAKIEREIHMFLVHFLQVRLHLRISLVADLILKFRTNPTLQVLKSRLPEDL